MGIIERKEREKEHRREDIITAAQKIFFEKGLPSATMDEIAEAAELSKGTLYLYYKSKEDLYLTVAMRGTEIMYQMFVDATSSNKPTIQRITDLGDAYYGFFKQHRDFFRMYQFFENPQFHKQVSAEMLSSCQVNNQKIWGIVVGVVQQGISEGLLDADLDPSQAAIILWSIGNSMMRQMDRDDNYWKEQLKVDLEATMRKAYQLVLEGMMTEAGKAQFKQIMSLQE